MFKHINSKILFTILITISLSSCALETIDLATTAKNAAGSMADTYIRPQTPSAVVVCRTQQCAPARTNMTTEFLYNSMLQLFDNNNGTNALICRADPATRTCVENFISFPTAVGITPAQAFIDSVKIVDIRLRKGTNILDLVLDYNLSYNGVKPACTPAKSILFARSTDYMLIEDAGYKCKMTSIGNTTVTTVFAIDYLDLDYGTIGGYYSVGLSGPAYGGGSGYMMLRLKNDAYPLKPTLVSPNAIGGNKRKGSLPTPNTEHKDTYDKSKTIPSKVQYKPIPLKK